MPHYADEYATALRYAAGGLSATQYFVHLRTATGQTSRRLVTSSKSAAEVREHYKSQGHFPLTVEPATDAHRAIAAKAGWTPKAEEPNPFVGFTKPAAPPTRPRLPLTARLSTALKAIKSAPAEFAAGFKEGFAPPPPPAPPKAAPRPAPPKPPLLKGVSPSYKKAPAPSATVRGVGDRPPPLPEPVERDGGPRHFRVTVQGATGSSTVVLSGADPEALKKDVERALGGRVTKMEPA